MIVLEEEYLRITKNQMSINSTSLFLVEIIFMLFMKKKVA